MPKYGHIDLMCKRCRLININVNVDKNDIEAARAGNAWATLSRGQTRARVDESWRELKLSHSFGQELSSTLGYSHRLSRALIEFEPAQIFRESWRESYLVWPRTRVWARVLRSAVTFFFQRAQIKGSDKMPSDSETKNNGQGLKKSGFTRKFLH